MLTEREEMVLAWMRGQLAKGEAATTAATGRRQRDLAAGVVVLTNAIAAIEAGEHLKRPAPSIPYETWRDEPSVG